MKFYLILFILTMFFACTQPKQKISTKQPNVVLIYTDDQGYEDVGIFGSPDILTPNIDALAKTGVQMTSFYAAQPICSASRAAIMTGCYPNRVGVHQAYMPNIGKGLALEETTIAEMLKEQGYATAIYGKWHLGDNVKFLPTRQGFDEYFGIPYSNDMWPHHPMQDKWFNFDPLPLYENETIIDTLDDQTMLTTQITERSVDFIQRNKDNPFFLYVPHPQPHVPLFVSDKFKGKSERGLYGDVIMELDWSVGEIVKTLKENGLFDNTIVIFASDNGPWLSYGGHSGSAKPFREGKATTFEGGQRVPFVISYPKKLKQAKLDIPMMNIDVLPTLAHYTKANLPDLKIDGLDYSEVLEQKTTKPPHQSFFNYYRTNELQSVRYKDWKLFFPNDYRTFAGITGTNDGLPTPYKRDTIKQLELYNLAVDKEERFDVAAENPKVIDTILQVADSFRLILGDSFQGIEGSENRPIGLVDETKIDQ